MAVQDGQTDRAVVPIENSLEGGVAATLDALAGPADGVRIVAEVVHPIHHNLIAGPAPRWRDVRKVLSIPHATGQCVRFLDANLPAPSGWRWPPPPRRCAWSAESDEPWAALGSALAAELYGCRVLAADVEDRDDNRTRFVWLAPAGRGRPADRRRGHHLDRVLGLQRRVARRSGVRARRALQRDINLTRIESRPRRVRLGPLHVLRRPGRVTADPHVAEALAALEARVHELRLLGSYPSGPDPGPRPLESRHRDGPLRSGSAVHRRPGQSQSLSVRCPPAGAGSVEDRPAGSWC